MGLKVVIFQLIGRDTSHDQVLACHDYTTRYFSVQKKLILRTRNCRQNIIRGQTTDCARSVKRESAEVDENKHSNSSEIEIRLRATKRLISDF